MTRSAKGTTENPGRNVRQKSGLNREILAQGWYGIRSKLGYKSAWNHRNFVPVAAPYTSRTCPKCGSTDKRNRLSRDIFRCTDCGHTNDADVNAAENIRRRGSTRPGQTNPPGRAAGGLQASQKAHSFSLTVQAGSGDSAARGNADSATV